MGRLPKNGIRRSIDANTLKTKHRHADTKYRSNVQYLYSKLKEMSQNKAPRDGILNDTLFHIQSLEKEIIDKVGFAEMKNYQNGFVNFLYREESLWKIKDPVKWWRKVEETLNTHDFIGSEETDSVDFSQSNYSILQQKNIIANTELPLVSCYDTKRTLCGLSTKNNKNLLDHAIDSSERNLFIPCEERPDPILSLEEEKYFSNEILAESFEFENNLF